MRRGSRAWLRHAEQVKPGGPDQTADDLPVRDATGRLRPGKGVQPTVTLERN